ncbi:HAD family hydrolase [Streptomyces anulatus]
MDGESGLRLLGLVALSDPPKPHAAATLASCRAAGITPILVTGDHPATASAVADRVELLGPNTTADHVVTGKDVAAGRVPDLTAHAFADACAASHFGDGRACKSQLYRHVHRAVEQLGLFRARPPGDGVGEGVVRRGSHA